MGGVTITCYGDRDECIHYQNGWCGLYDRRCDEIHIDMIKEDGEE